MLFILLKLCWIVLIPFMVTGFTFNSTDEKYNETIEEDSNDYTFLVVGGYRPKEHTLAKFMVSLRDGSGAGGSHYCGGSIIKSKVILTAAHCVMDQNGRPVIQTIIVVAGSPFLHKTTPSTRYYGVSKTLVHPVFSYQTMRSDIALIFLEEPIDLDEKTKSALPLMDTSPKSGMECVSLGWGRIFPNGPRPVELVYVNLSVLKRSACSEFFTMNPAVICAADLEDREKGVWKGDSGGPLICEGKLTGVVSFGFPKENSPSYFANVYEHRKWILENLGNIVNLDLSCFLFVSLVFFLSDVLFA